MSFFCHYHKRAHCVTAKQVIDSKGKAATRIIPARPVKVVVERYANKIIQREYINADGRRAVEDIDIIGQIKREEDWCDEAVEAGEAGARILRAAYPAVKAVALIDEVGDVPFNGVRS